MFSDVPINKPSPKIILSLRKIAGIPVALIRNGFPRCLHVGYICFVLPAVMPVLPICLRLYTWIKRIGLKYYFAEKKIRYWRQNKETLLSLADKGYKTKVQQLGLDWEKVTSSENARRQIHKVELGEIDQDGFLLSKVGAISNVPIVSKKQFLARKRFGLRVVAIDGYVCIEKHYNGNKSSFVNEIEAHYYLGRAGCNIPVIMDVDFDNLTLTFSYISGPVLREELAGRGAVVRDRDIEENPELTRFGKRKRALNRTAECRRVLSEVVDSQFIDHVFAELNKMHEARFIWNDIKYGNIILEERSGKPFLIDFDWALRFEGLGKNAFRILCDRDIEKFNACFGTEKLTYKRIKSELEHRTNNETFAPVYFGYGLRNSNIRNTNNGCSRWQSVLRNNLLSVSGKRILDLECTNAVDAIQMLRSGAQEVVGISCEPGDISQGNFVKSAFEWAENRQYAFKYVQANTDELSKINLGSFDIVMAPCPTEHPGNGSFDNIVKHISTIAPTFVLQCNPATNINRREQLTCEKAAVEYALNALSSNGFPFTQVVAPYRNSRPLIIGTIER